MFGMEQPGPTIESLTKEVERLTQWMKIIEGSMCEDAEPLRRWAYRARMGETAGDRKAQAAVTRADPYA